MDINEMFPSKYLKVVDLQNKRVAVTIDKVTVEDIANEKRAVVYFRGKLRGLVLNKTNAAMIAEIAGSSETSEWTGVKMSLYPTRVDFQGRRVDAIRIDRVIDGDNAADTK